MNRRGFLATCFGGVAAAVAAWAGWITAAVTHKEQIESLEYPITENYVKRYEAAMREIAQEQFRAIPEAKIRPGSPWILCGNRIMLRAEHNDNWFHDLT
jgi:hypothetical protein